MDLITALRILNIDDINNLNEAILKDRFRKLIKENHPDMGGKVEKAVLITTANSVVKSALSTIKSYRNLTGERKEYKCVIPINKLSKLYLGDELDVQSSDGERLLLDRNNFRNHKVILLTKTSIVYRGQILKYDAMCVTNMKDEYEVVCRLPDGGVNNVEKISITVYDKTVTTTIAGAKLNIVLSFDRLVKLTVHIERIERNG